MYTVTINKLMCIYIIILSLRDTFWIEFVKIHLSFAITILALNVIGYYPFL